jgi:hypothetical protein
MKENIARLEKELIGQKIILLHCHDTKVKVDVTMKNENLSDVVEPNNWQQEETKRNNNL